MKYFCKYLPVEGEIKEGDYFIVNNTKPVKCVMKDFPQNSKGVKKVKLFLCSRDIKDGDTITHESGLNFAPSTGDQKGNKKWFKVIGEVSPDAIWIKEGDEFEGQDIDWQYAADYYDDKYSESNMVVIKCSQCKHFH